jgi:hypothetical protein
VIFGFYLPLVWEEQVEPEIFLEEVEAEVQEQVVEAAVLVVVVEHQGLIFQEDVLIETPVLVRCHLMMLSHSVKRC